MFDKQLYVQRDGAPMGGCISPTLANIFLSYHEEKWLDNCPLEFKPIMYRRYVDDTFLLFRDSSHILPFRNFLNNQHSRIEFTSETEMKNSLSFLDVQINKNNHKFSTDLYRKPTFTGLGLKYNSSITQIYKINLIKCLIDRAYKICSSYNSLSNELENIKKYFCQNGYPLNLVENSIRCKLNSIFTPFPESLTVPKAPIYLKLPYMNSENNKSLKTELSDLLGKYYPQIDLRILFMNNNSVGRFFNYKDRIPDFLQSNIVYKYSCPQCSETYVGESSRHMYTRIAEHRGVSPRTGLPCINPKSNIYKHFLDSGHIVSPTAFSILHSENTSSLKVIESIYIHKLHPSLNGMQYSTPLNILCL